MTGIVVSLRGDGEAGGEVADTAGDAEDEDGPGDERRPRGGEAEERVEGEAAGTGEAEGDGAGGVEERDLDAVARDEHAVAPVDRDGGDDHHGEHDRGTDRTEEPEGDQQTADDLAERGGEGEGTSGTEAELLH